MIGRNCSSSNALGATEVCNPLRPLLSSIGPHMYKGALAMAVPATLSAVARRTACLMRVVLQFGESVFSQYHLAEIVSTRC